MQSTFYLEAGESGSSLKSQENNVDPNQLMKGSMKKDGIREETRWNPPGSCGLMLQILYVILGAIGNVGVF